MSSEKVHIDMYNEASEETRERVDSIAKRMALAVNGGDWEKDYTHFQQVGWKLKALFVINYLE